MLVQCKTLGRQERSRFLLQDRPHEATTHYFSPTPVCHSWILGPPPHIPGGGGTTCDSCGPSPPSACGDCPDPIPECQEGEALTVDRNTTELCCPVYQCGESQLDMGT